MIRTDLPIEQTTVVVAMSGGVDSSVVAAMLAEQGYRVIGITLQLYDHGKFAGKKGACCAGQDIYDAKMVADKIGIPHYTLDYESRFKEAVIEDFVDSYIKGETPLPCVRCNQSVKFKDLVKFAKDLGADALATGHYVRRVETLQGIELHSGLETAKDQSYFLFATTKEQLEFLRFPLGNNTKEETRAIAAKFGLEVANKADSQDICFVQDGNYKNVIAKLKPASIEKGKIMHIDGWELGEHEGIINYTIGQRRGIGIAYNQPLYVIRVDPDTKIVYVGPESALFAKKFIIKEVNWLADDLDLQDLEVKVKIRSTRAGSLAKVLPLQNDTMLVEMLSTEKAITPGQACVIYSGDRVLGGGWITREIN